MAGLLLKTFCLDLLTGAKTHKINFESKTVFSKIIIFLDELRSFFSSDFLQQR